MLNRNSSRAGLVEVHVQQTGIPNAGGESTGLSVSREISGQRIVHEPRSSAQRYVSVLDWEVPSGAIPMGWEGEELTIAFRNHLCIDT